MRSYSSLFASFACICLFVSAFARPFYDQESSDLLEEDVPDDLVDPHKLLKDLFADRPLRFDKRGGPIWGNKRQNLPALREIRKMRCYFNPVSC